jgi:hypothetical protein
MKLGSQLIIPPQQIIGGISEEILKIQKISFIQVYIF